MKNSHIPSGVNADIAAGKSLFEQELGEEQVDPHHERILTTLEDIVVKIDDEQKEADGYIFNHEEFIDACNHVVEDQLSALRKDKLSIGEFSSRFNRWFVFCDAVVNLGISCLYPKEALKDGEYETVFKTLKLNKNFETTFLKPCGIKIELRHKSKEVMEKYPWLAMPVLIINDADGIEHQIAITPSPTAKVWWLDILANFHGSYNWILSNDDGLIDEEDEEVRTTTVADFNAKRFETVDTAIEAPVDYVRSPTVVNAVSNNSQGWIKRLWNRFTSWFK